jgi:hypothetical protein
MARAQSRILTKCVSAFFNTVRRPRALDADELDALLAALKERFSHCSWSSAAAARPAAAGTQHGAADPERQVP